jgi:hypothetical protein
MDAQKAVANKPNHLPRHMKSVFAKLAGTPFCRNTHANTKPTTCDCNPRALNATRFLQASNCTQDRQRALRHTHRARRQPPRACAEGKETAFWNRSATFYCVVKIKDAVLTDVTATSHVSAHPKYPKPAPGRSGNQLRPLAHCNKAKYNVVSLHH